jgi:hypothetical protein
MAKYWIHKLKKGTLTNYARRHHAIIVHDGREVIDMPKLARGYGRMSTRMKRAYNAALRLRSFHMPDHMASESKRIIRRMQA